jgi:hypothetical protein
MKRIICMLVVMAAITTAAQAWTIDGPGVGTGGWNAIWNGPMNWDVWDDQAVSGGVGSWSFFPINTSAIIQPGGVNQAETNKWWIRPTVAPGGKGGTNRYAYAPAADTSKWGVTFVNPAVSGKAADVAAIATMISPSEMMVQHDWGYQYYRPDVYSWENKPYFKTDARIAAINAQGASMRINTYAYLPNGAWDTAPKTLISYTDIPLGADMEWQVIHTNAAAKVSAAMAAGNSNLVVGAWLLFEVQIVGGNADTRLFIDELDFFSDALYTDPVAAATVPTWVLPEPATMSILALGGLLLRRKK